MSINKKIALFLDCENISHEYLKDIFDELANHGKAILKHAYTDWSKSNSKQWENKLHDFGIKAIQVQSNIHNKNASDMQIVIDIMNTINVGIAETIILVSSDSDFTSIAHEVTKKGLDMIGFGEEKTNKSFRNACTSFIELPVKKTDKDFDENHLIQILSNSIVATQGNEESAFVSRVGTYLKNQSADYIPRNYGGNTWGEILKKYPLRFLLSRTNKKNSTLCVALKD